VGNGRGQVHVGLGFTRACILALLSVLGQFLPFTSVNVNLLPCTVGIYPHLFLLNTMIHSSPIYSKKNEDPRPEYIHIQKGKNIQRTLKEYNNRKD
jgi:hypothetical protein